MGSPASCSVVCRRTRPTSPLTAAARRCWTHRRSRMSPPPPNAAARVIELILETPAKAATGRRKGIRWPTCTVGSSMAPIVPRRASARARPRASAAGKAMRTATVPARDTNGTRECALVGACRRETIPQRIPADAHQRGIVVRGPRAARECVPYKEKIVVLDQVAGTAWPHVRAGVVWGRSPCGGTEQRPLGCTVASAPSSHKQTDLPGSGVQCAPWSGMRTVDSAGGLASVGRDVASC